MFYAQSTSWLGVIKHTHTFSLCCNRTRADKNTSCFNNNARSKHVAFVLLYRSFWLVQKETVPSFITGHWPWAGRRIILIQRYGGKDWNNPSVGVNYLTFYSVVRPVHIVWPQPFVAALINRATSQWCGNCREQNTCVTGPVGKLLYSQAYNTLARYKIHLFR